MNKIGFFTAVRYSDNLKLSAGESALQTVDNYFYLGGKKAHVITDGESTRGAILSGTNSSLIARAIKVASYFTVILPLILLAVKAALRYSLQDTYNFTLINPAERLVEQFNQRVETYGLDGLDFNDVINDVLLQIKDYPNGSNPSEESCVWCGTSEKNGIQWCARKSGDRVAIELLGNGELSLSGLSILFHTSEQREGGEDKTTSSYKDLITVKEVAIANELDKIRVNPAKLFLSVGGGTHTHILQRALSEGNSEASFRVCNKYLPGEVDKVVRQITTLMARTQFTHDKNGGYPFTNFACAVKNGNVAETEVTHIENGAADSQANQVPFTQGLLKLALTKEQVNIIDKELSKQGIWLATKDVKQRWDEIEVETKLEKYYADCKIDDTAENDDHWNLPLIDLTTLGLNLNETGKIKRDEKVHDWEMRNAVNFVIKFINLHLSKSKVVENKTVKERRSIDLDLAHINRALYESIGGQPLPRWEDDLMCFKSVGTDLPGNRQHVDEAARKKLWLPRILQALKDKGHVFDFTVDPKCLHYHIQA